MAAELGKTKMLESVQESGFPGVLHCRARGLQRAPRHEAVETYLLESKEESPVETGETVLKMGHKES